MAQAGKQIVGYDFDRDLDFIVREDRRNSRDSRDTSGDSLQKAIASSEAQRALASSEAKKLAAEANLRKMRQSSEDAQIIVPGRKDRVESKLVYQWDCSKCNRSCLPIRDESRCLCKYFRNFVPILKFSLLCCVSLICVCCHLEIRFSRWASFKITQYSEFVPVHRIFLSLSSSSVFRT